MTRADKILQHINKSGIGVEVGPSHNGVARKAAGWNVHIIDHADREALIEKFRPHKVNLNNIEQVDFVWSGEAYAELTGKRKYYDWVIASHLIEHTPDFIGFLLDCDEILKDEGVLSLAIPDLRYCFDYFRPPSGLGAVIDAYFRGDRIHTPGKIAENKLNVVEKGGTTTWHKNHKGGYKFRHTYKQARELIDRVNTEKKYIDTHAWTFTPASFRLIIQDLYFLGLIPFKEVAFSPTDGAEFFVTLGRRGAEPSEDRLELLQRAKNELAP